MSIIITAHVGPLVCVACKSNIQIRSKQALAAHFLCAKEGMSPFMEIQNECIKVFVNKMVYYCNVEKEATIQFGNLKQHTKKWKIYVDI